MSIHITDVPYDPSVVEIYAECDACESSVSASLRFQIVLDEPGESYDCARTRQVRSMLSYHGWSIVYSTDHHWTYCQDCARSAHPTATTDPVPSMPLPPTWGPDGASGPIDIYVNGVSMGSTVKAPEPEPVRSRYERLLDDDDDSV